VLLPRGEQVKRAAGERDVRAVVTRVRRGRLVLVRGRHQAEREATHAGRPVLHHVLVTTVEVATVAQHARDATDGEVTERIDGDGRRLPRRVPTTGDDATPVALEADAAVTAGERAVVLVRTEHGLELEESLQPAAQIFGATHAEQ